MSDVLTQQQKKAVAIFALLGGEALSLNIAIRQFFGEDFDKLVTNGYIQCISAEVACMPTVTYKLTEKGWNAVAEHGHSAIKDSMSDRNIL